MALSISSEEAKSSIRFLREAFLGWKNGEIWVRPHPFLDLKKVLKRDGLHPLPPPFRMMNGPLYPLLETAPIVIVGESSVTLEALAHGCAIMAIDSPEWVNMSPLRGYGTTAYRSFDSPKVLREEVDGLLARLPSPLVEDSERVRVVQDFFNLEWDEPQRLLALLS